MAISLPGFDAEQVYRILSDFWSKYKERDQLATIWGGLSQIMDNEYLQLYQADFSKALDTVPLYWRYQWVNLLFNNWISNEVLHEHHWYERTTTAIDERSTGQLVQISGATELHDTLINFSTEGIRIGHYVTIDTEEYRVSSVLPNVLTIEASLPSSTGVTYSVGEKEFNLIGSVTFADEYDIPNHPDGNTFEAVATSGQVTLELPWFYTRGIGEIEVYKNNVLLAEDDYIENNNHSIKFVPALLGGEGLKVIKEYKVRVVSVILSGVLLTEGVDYEVEDFNIILSDTLGHRNDDGLGYNIMIKWQELTVPVPHSHRQFEEILDSPKDTWTNSPGDAFEPEPSGPGPYQFGDLQAPLEFWVNGVKQIRGFQSEPNSVTLTIGEPLESGDSVLIRWIRNDADPDQHKHLRYTNVLSSSVDSVKIPFSVDASLNKQVVYINGVMQTIDVDYSIVGVNSDIITFNETLVATDIIELEFYQHEYLYRHEIDPIIKYAPIIQDGIDLPSIVSIEGETHEVREGWLYSDYDFDEVWIPNLFTNEAITENNFGDQIGFNRKNSQDYLNSTRGLWFCYWNGPSFKNIEIGSKILMGVPFAPKTTTVKKRTPLINGETVVLETSGGNSYDINLPLKPIVKSGDTIPAFHPLADGVEIWDYVTNPEWYKNFPNLYQLWDQFSTSGDPYVGFWDDRGFLDDGGFFDDGGPGSAAEIEALNKKLFDLIKWFIFIVNVDASLFSSEERVSDLIFFLDTIKPAYTKYIINTFLPGTDDIFERRATDKVEFTAELDPFVDSMRYRWDDGGMMDITDCGITNIASSFGQTDIDLPFTYRIGAGSLKVQKDNVLQVIGVDYQEVHAAKISFLSPLLGTEMLRLHEDDSYFVHMDKGESFDTVQFTLMP